MMFFKVYTDLFVIILSVIWLSRTILFCHLLPLCWKHCGWVVGRCGENTHLLVHKGSQFVHDWSWNYTLHVIVAVKYKKMMIHNNKVIFIWPPPGGPRGVITERGLRCGAVCGHSRLRSDLHYMPGGPQVSSKSSVPPHLLQEMHFTVA